MTITESIKHYTLADYLQWQGDWELIQGRPVAMTPSPGVTHQRICLKIARQFDYKEFKKTDDYSKESWFLISEDALGNWIFPECGSHRQFFCSYSITWKTIRVIND